MLFKAEDAEADCTIADDPDAVATALNAKVDTAEAAEASVVAVSGILEDIA